MDTCPPDTSSPDREYEPGASLGSLRATSTAKRIGAGATLDRWYPYYAGYTHRFATDVIAELCGKRACRVLDPWNGSGTTTAAAFHAGHTPLGFDLNPGTLVIANAKLAHRGDLDSLPDLLEDCLRAARETPCSKISTRTEPLGLWLPPKAAEFARCAFRWLGLHSESSGIAQLAPAHSLVAVCLLRALRRSAVDVRSNSSWVVPNDGRRSVRIASVEKLARLVALDIYEDRHDLPVIASPVRAQLGDARALELPNDSVDFVLTSPPYCTRIDYAKQMSFELAALFGHDDQRSKLLRNQLMGTTTLREPSQSVLSLPSAIQDLLDAVRSHQSHRSEAYYYRNMKQYFDDAFLAVREVARVMRAGARAVLVLQNSYYKELSVPLSDLFCDLGKASGLEARVVVRRPVGRSMVSLNTRARKYAANRAYSEDLVLMEKKS